MEKFDEIDIIILEGWMLGYKPILDNQDIEINIFNNNLKKYENLHNLINIWIIIETDNLDNIYNKVPSDKNCRFCDYKDKPDLCDRKVG